MKRFFLIVMALVSASAMQAQYNYKSVDGDPMKARIYKLSNGLTICLTDNAEQPRIQTYIAVRAGGKNDPAESTGLAHYLEHLMFKGTSSFGTNNYAMERPILDKIEEQYETYASTTDPEERKAIYHVIDSLSYESSKHAIANEYDKLMSGIGSDGTNAYTAEDVTCYTEDIPSNEVERWALIQSNRFQDMVIRGFHTELEAVYEEYNIHLASDFDKLNNAINNALFPHHPYGTQTVIGTQEHLKNPSLKNVKNYYRTWYVPNNVAICMSGDLGGNPDSIVAIIDKHFGNWQPNRNLPVLSFPAEEPILNPIYKKVYGREREQVALAWRMPKVSDKDYDRLTVASQLLYNGKAGLLDLDLNQSQKVMSAEVFVNGMADYSAIWAVGLPKDGQTLEEVSKLMLFEIEKLKKGDFPEGLLKAIVNNMKRDMMAEQEKNDERADMMVKAFINNVEWKDVVNRLNRIESITKNDIVEFANRYFTDGYVCVNKYQGEDPNEKKIDKPVISPIEMNRDKQSQFVRDVLAMSVNDISPVFVDFDKDMSKVALKNGNTLLYKQNTENDLFQLEYLVERGSKQSKLIWLASQYINYLGTPKMSAEELQSELYGLACDATVEVSESLTKIHVSGLGENMEKAMRITEDWINAAKADDEILAEMVEDFIKLRTDDKLDQQMNFARICDYGMYGRKNVYTDVLTNEQMRGVTSKQLLDELRNLKDYQQTICYYGPATQDEILKRLALHRMSKKPIPAEKDNHYKLEVVSTPEVMIAPYDAKNIYMISYSNDGKVYDAAQQAKIDVFNEYFGGGMNTVVFQELRESRGLAYNASASFYTPSWKGDTNSFWTMIISQNDKMADCIDVFDQITEEMPLSESAFGLSKEVTLKRMATQRYTKNNVLALYLWLSRKGIDHNPYPQIYKEIKAMTLQDLADFQKENVKGRTYRYVILGDEKELDMKKLESMGRIRRLTTEEIFGY